MGGQRIEIATPETDGWDSYNNTDLDETKVQVCDKGGVVGDVHVTNETASKFYVKVWLALSTNVTVGSTAPDWVWPVVTAGSTDGAGFIRSWLPQGRKFDTGLTIACVTGIGDAASSGPAANGCIYDMTYKQRKL
jgi:hypothetical protein